jgi:hypothetical protein
LLVPFIFDAFVGSFVIFKYYLETMTAIVMVVKVTISNNLIDDDVSGILRLIGKRCNTDRQKKNQMDGRTDGIDRFYRDSAARPCQNNNSESVWERGRVELKTDHRRGPYFKGEVSIAIEKLRRDRTSCLEEAYGLLPLC